MMTSILNSLVRSMEESGDKLKLLTNTTKLGSIGEKFNSLPNLEVPSSLSFSDLMELVKKNMTGLPTTIGTTLRSEGSPVAVLFDMKQYGMVKSIIGYIPHVIEGLRGEFENGIKLKEMGLEILGKISGPLNSTLFTIGCGTVAAIWGAFEMGRTYQEISCQEISTGKKQSQYALGYLLPMLSVAVGIVLIATSMISIRNVSANCFDIATALRAQ